jgi:hypothetical protein
VTGLKIQIAIDGLVELRLGPECCSLRERLGMTAWVALEVLVLAGEVDGAGRLTVGASARGLAGRLGIGKDRAAGALAVLRDAGLLVRVESRAGRSARFVAHRYQVRLPVSRAADAVRLSGRAGRTGEVQRIARDAARLFEVES